jgi:hypothetical protein
MISSLKSNIQAQNIKISSPNISNTPMTLVCVLVLFVFHTPLLQSFTHVPPNLLEQ